MSQLSETVATYNSNATIDYRKRVNVFTWVLWFLLALGISAFVGLTMVYASPNPSIIAWLLFFAGIVAILNQPRYGIYLIIFFSLVGDKSLLPWYPFQLNFSSAESLLYISNSLIVSPLEVYLVVTLLSWLVQGAIQRRLRFNSGELFWPTLIFMFFVVFGMVYGLGRGGNVNVALWEARPIFYLPVMLILTSNLITDRGHFTTLIGLVLSALFIEGLVGVFTYISNLSDRTGILAAAFMEHSASVHMASFFVFSLATWLYKGPLKVRILILLMGIPVLFTFFIAQRRAAIFALLFALILMALILYKENRQAFWIIIPSLTLLFAVYMVVFWNHPGTLGFPARAIKSQLAPQQSDLRDQYSNIYRIMENYNIAYTIRQAPLTGIGFGQMFTMAIPLPDISFFVWYRYITHNSIGWIWMKTGIGGFVAMLCLVGLSIMTGVRNLLRLPGGVVSAVVITATLYILMHFIYAYVDMSWDGQSMVYIGMMMGLIGCSKKIMEAKRRDYE